MPIDQTMLFFRPLLFHATVNYSLQPDHPDPVSLLLLRTGQQPFIRLIITSPQDA